MCFLDLPFRIFLGLKRGQAIFFFGRNNSYIWGGPMVNSILSRPTHASVFEIGWRLGPWFIYHQWKGANDRLCVALTVENLGWNKMAGHPDFWTGSVKQIITNKIGDFDSQDLHMRLSASMVPPIQIPWLISNFLLNFNNLVSPDFWTFPNHTISLLVAYPIISTWLSHYIPISWLFTSIIRYSTISPYNWFRTHLHWWVVKL